MQKKGKVVWFSSGKGIGFIAPSEGGEDIFVHFTSIDPAAMTGYRTLKPEQTVLYEVETGPKGKPQAAKVRVIK